MTKPTARERAHALDATVRVGKGGIESAAAELAAQLESRELVKVKFLRAARGGTDADALAADLADRVDADVVETRGHTATFKR